MKKVSIQELKRNLSSLVAEAAAGARILITRHKEPLAYLESAELEHLHVGRRYGRAQLKPLLQGPTRGRYLKVLANDRRGKAERS